jgi:hypothetical protein
MPRDTLMYASPAANAWRGYNRALRWQNGACLGMLAGAVFFLVVFLFQPKTNSAAAIGLGILILLCWTSSSIFYVVTDVKMRFFRCPSCRSRFALLAFHGRSKCPHCGAVRQRD